MAEPTPPTGSDRAPREPAEQARDDRGQCVDAEPTTRGAARGTFDVVMTPGAAEIGGAVQRFAFAKTFHGDLDAAGAGVMLAVGDPQTGSAGYVAIETVDGRLGDRSGGFALQQLGRMHGGAQTLRYEVVPGSGHGTLEGLAGTLHLSIDDDGTHHYDLDYELHPPAT